MTSQVSSASGKADEANDAVLGGQRAPLSGTTGVVGGGGKEVRRLDRVIIRFAGDSGDGMQLT
ncbi:hypothetical protein, partial [Streptomyces sp. NPDC006267]|uniref:hypothetical protein n=1 Tax=Streptomyces sp. NPDC006267 TaxID=3157173 RepID=UPI0033A3E838